MAETTHIRSFRVCFSVERRIHKLDRWRIPVPYGVPVRGIVYFAAAALVMLVLGALPVFGELFAGMNMLTRLAIVPGAIAFVLYRLSLDGRPSHAVAAAWLRMQMGPRRMSAFQRLDEPAEVRLGTLMLAPDERAARMRAGVVRGPAEVVLRYPTERQARGDRMNVRQFGAEPLWRGTRVTLKAGQEVVCR